MTVTESGTLRRRAQHLSWNTIEAALGNAAANEGREVWREEDCC